jgi:hypothetical protein
MRININKKSLIINNYLQLILVGVFIQIIYLWFSKNFYKIGFPLDDSWIHLTYARNLVEFGGWFYIPGISSAGSTSPLWTLLLTPGFFFSSPFFYVWTFALSGILFISSAIIFQKIFEEISNKKFNIPWVGFLFLFEWHLVWSVNSGMETILYIFIILVVFYYLITRKMENLWIFWLLLGIVIYVRPDGITLIGPFLMINFIYFLRNDSFSFKNLVLGLIVIILFVAYYAFFNFQLSGEYLPNTFFAKQAEYQILYSKPLIKRFFELFLISITGVGILLLPGFLYFLFISIMQRKWEILSVYLWYFGTLLIYSVRLPVTYQHGRYVIPTIPVYLILSVVGMYTMFQRPSKNGNLVQFGYKTAAIAVLFIFFILGGQAYAEDVAIIETEMVDTAKWINENLPTDSVIAAHDIGALGFFANCQIIDLAGLISPEVIPFIRDENQLVSYMNLNEVDYLVVFPGWYIDLNQSKTEIFSTHGSFSPQAGGENMTIYIWE